ncbi:MAG: serine/threonine-protein kinase [Gemmataceae bacterium]
MHVICPNCNDTIDVPETATLTGLVCPSCGSDVRPPSGSTTGWAAPEVERVGRFRLLAVAGQGAFGAVYRAEDTELGRVVAVKVPRAGTLTDRQDRDRFLREARSAARLRHPHIVPVHEVGEWEGRPFLVSDFVEGVTLADRLSGGRPPVREAVALCAAADALHYARRRGPPRREAVQRAAGGGDSPHLTDFGGPAGRRRHHRPTGGCSAYMSPERADAGHAVDGRADVLAGWCCTSY